MRYFQRLNLYPAIQEQLLGKTTPIFILAKSQRKEIIRQLMASQKSLCCYCECQISAKKCHIDHFEEQHDAPTRIFDYTNMLLSCERPTKTIDKSAETDEDKKTYKDSISCGHRKTKVEHGNTEVDYSLLLNPTDNISALFSYYDGVIEPSKLCHLEQVQQVNYTVNRLNLDTYRLENARVNEIEAIQKQLVGLTEEKQKTFISSLLDETQTILNPYFSTIKDNFGFLLLS